MRNSPRTPAAAGDTGRPVFAAPVAGRAIPGAAAEPSAAAPRRPRRRGPPYRSPRAERPSTARRPPVRLRGRGARAPQPPTREHLRTFRREECTVRRYVGRMEPSGPEERRGWSRLLMAPSTLLAAPLAALGILLAVDELTGPNIRIGGLMIAVPALSAVFLGPMAVAAVSVISLGCVVLAAVENRRSALRTSPSSWSPSSLSGRPPSWRRCCGGGVSGSWRGSARSPR